MADDKKGRVKKSQDAEKRQRERELTTELARREEPEPPIDTAALADLESELESLTFPATGREIIAAVGDHDVKSVSDAYTIEGLLPETDVETFESPAAIRMRIQRPTVAVAMKRVVEATANLSDPTLSESQRDAYEKTFLELKAIDSDDDDDGVRAITDWIVERIEDKETPPGSRDVRRQAAKYCRANGYQVRDDEWLGI